MKGIIRVGLAGLAIAWAAPLPPPLHAADEKKTQAAEPAIPELIEDLGHPVYSVRERASRELWKRGEAAREAVAKAALSSDAEVARRAKELLEKFEWGIFPDTPPEVVKLLKEFRSGDLTRQKSAIVSILAHGRPGRAVLRSALNKSIPTDADTEMGKEINSSQWRQLSEFLAVTVRREALKQLTEERRDDVEDLLSLNLLGASTAGLADYAVYQYLRGTVPEASARLEATRKSAGPAAAPARLALVYLYRAQREWAKARALAENLPQAPNEPRILEMLLEEEGDWAALAKRDAPGRANLPDGMRITLLRLSGKTRDADNAADELVKQADAFTTREDVQQIAFSLLLNQRATEATALLLEKRMNLGLLAELLIAEMRFKDALDLVGGKAADAATDAREGLEFDLRRARLLFMLGKRSDAIQLFGKVAESLRLNPEGGRLLGDTGLAIRSLLRAEVRLGLRDVVAEHAALFLASDDRRFRDMFRWSESPFEILFDSDARPAEALFWALRGARAPSDSAGDSMRRVRELFIGSAPAAAVDEAVKLLRDANTGDPPEADESTVVRRKVERLMAEAAILKAAKRFAEAETAYLDAAKAASPGGDDDDDEELNRPRGARSWVYGTSDDFRPWLELGDFYTDRGRHADAAKQFEVGWRKFPEQPILLFLGGQALKRAGRVPEGEKKIELSHWVSLGNERVRGRFLEELVRRGAANAARRETDLLLHACWSRDGYFGNVMNQAARAAILNKDFTTAETCVQRSLMVLLKVPGVHFVEAVSYLTVPQNMAALRARALLAEGKVAEAMKRARAYLAIQPGSSGFAIDMVQDLDAMGKTKEADELFRGVWDTYAKMLDEHPESASARNSAAWLAANCRRELDRALKLAEEAVKLDPTSVGYRESLAEVHFRRGDRDKALTIMTKLAEESPRSRLFRRQLERYRTGDPASPIPETEKE